MSFKTNKYLKYFTAWATVVIGVTRNRLFIRDLFCLEHENETKFGTQKHPIILKSLRALGVPLCNVTCN